MSYSRWAVYAVVGWGLLLPALRAQTPATSGYQMGPAVDRVLARFKSREELSGKLSSGFDQDSFDFYALRGVSRTEDSTIVAWFTGFSTFLEATTLAECTEIMKGIEPGLNAMRPMRTGMDSAAVEGWLHQWETAAVAFFTRPARPAADDDAFGMVMLGLIAEFSQDTTLADMRQKPGAKPTARDQCRIARLTFNRLINRPEPERTMVLRGMAEMISDNPPKKKD
jgi:hypothetical protein